MYISSTDMVPRFRYLNMAEHHMDLNTNIQTNNIDFKYI